MDLLFCVVGQSAKIEKTIKRDDGTATVITRVRVRLRSGYHELIAEAEGAQAIEINDNPLQVGGMYVGDISFRVGEWKDEKSGEQMASTFIRLNKIKKF